MKIAGPVLAATALDQAGDEVIRQSAALAEHAGVGLVVCHVLPEIYGVRPLFPHLREADRPHAEAARRGVMEAADRQLRRVLEEAPANLELRIEAGSPHVAVLMVADEVGAGLVVVGSGSHEDGASLGGVAERIVRHARSPVLVARRAPGAVVLAATDFSDPALPAVVAGRDEARRRGLRFAVLHAVEVRALPPESLVGSQAPVIQYLVEAGTERAQGLLAEIVRESSDEVETILTVGLAADAILEAAARLRAELVVVGRHGRTGLGRLTLGSVAESVIRRARAAVLVVPLA